jgi:hypothetical protein
LTEVSLRYILSSRIRNPVASIFKEYVNASFEVVSIGNGDGLIYLRLREKRADRRAG